LTLRSQAKEGFTPCRLTHQAVPRAPWGGHFFGLVPSRSGQREVEGARCAHENGMKITHAAMTKSELIEIITAKQKHLPAKDVELALKQILEIMSDALSQGERIEIRGFGSFSLHFRPPRQGRNPKTGEAVALSGKYVPHFKPGKDLRERVNDGAERPIRD
jgi:integration host factor subunit beta